MTHPLGQKFSFFIRARLIKRKIACYSFSIHANIRFNLISNSRIFEWNTWKNWIEAIEITEMIHPISLHLQFWNWNAKRGGYFWNWTTGWITIFDLSLLLFEYKFEIGVLTDGMKKRNYVRSYLRMCSIKKCKL